MIISPQSLDTNLSQLLAEVKSGSMQLPEFQRDWTWDDNRIRGIIASLSQGYPMGAIMRLQYGNPDIQFKYRTITGVKGVSVKPEHLILDGQQLHAALQRLLLLPLGDHQQMAQLFDDGDGHVVGNGLK